MQFQGGDATLAALLLAYKLGVEPVGDKIASHSGSNPDPESFYGKGGHFIGKDKARSPIDKAFLDLVKGVNPSFDPAKQMHETIINPGYPNYPGAMAHNTKANPETFTIKHNYGVDRAVYAHELGHVLGQNTPVAREIAAVRKYLQHNPKLSDAISKGLDMVPGLPKEAAQSLVKRSLSPAGLFKGSRYLAPALAAGMIEGDEDLATSLAMSVAMTAPQLLDEGIASTNALRIMNKAGDPATGLQKRRLAAAFGDYLAPALIAGLSGNIVGNLVD